MRTCHVFLLLLLAIGFSVHAGMPDPLEIPRDGAVYRLVFCARASPDTAAGVAAHAFVAFASVQPSEKRTYQAVGAVAGLQPRGLIGYSTVLQPMPNPLKSLDFGLLISHCLVFEVKRHEFMAARQAAEAKLEALSTAVPKADVWGAYGLSPEQVVKLFVEILSPLRGKGLLVPQRVAQELPFAYLRRLIDQNLRVARSADLELGPTKRVYTSSTFWSAYQPFHEPTKCVSICRMFDHANAGSET